MGTLYAYFALRQKRNPYLWFAIGFCLGQFGILALFFMPRKAQKKNSPLPEKPILEGPVDKWWYYLDAEQQQQGPMSFDAMNRAWKEGKAELETYVWHEELPEWKPLKEFLKD